MKLSIDLSQFKSALDEKLNKIHEAVRPSAQAGAQVLYDQARFNAPISEDAHFFYSRRGKGSKVAGEKYLFYPGDLKKSIYQVYSKKSSSSAVALYQISYNSQKCPYAHMVEFGTTRADAHPFIGIVVNQAGSAAIDAIANRFQEEISK